MVARMGQNGGMSLRVPGRLPIEGTYNLREVSGYEMEGGAPIRAGRLFRSDHLAALSEAGREALGGLSIGCVVDLRMQEEAERLPGRLEGLGVEVMLHPLFNGAQLIAFSEGLTLASLYVAMLDGVGPRLAGAIRHIAQRAPGGVLVHCTAGKDRTGLTIALALLAVGVDRQVVLEDYAASQANLSGPWADAALEKLRAGGYAPPPEVVELVTASPPEALDEALRHLDSSHGGVRDYLGRHGFGADDVARLRDALA